ncbi:hypothetical protein GOBAR_DD04132 [Gossypium barbadense]|nr:hypothetical protein GOBAR_DD04132 [Gossypium barbadense]
MSGETASSSGIILEGIDDVEDYVSVSTFCSSYDCLDAEKIHAKRDRRICDAYVMCKEKTEDEVISTFLQLISSQASPGLHVIHIAAEMAPVAKGVQTPGGNRLLTK